MDIYKKKENFFLIKKMKYLFLMVHFIHPKKELKFFKELITI